MASPAKSFPWTRLLRGCAPCLLMVVACDSPTGEDGNVPPVAVAEANDLVCVGTAVQLDGTASSDADGDSPTFAWSFVSAPAGSSAALSNATSAVAEFVPDVGGEYRVELRVSDGTAEAADTAVVAATPDELPGTISSDTTLTMLCPVYRADHGVVVEAAVVVEPGVTLMFQGGSNSRLIVDDAGSLTAIGTAEDTIRFLAEPAAAGSWGGIEVRSNSPDNELAYVEVAHGGAGSYHDIRVNGGAQLKLTNSLIRGSDRHGLYVDGVLSGFAGNTFRDNALAPVSVRAEQMGALDGASIYAGGNGADRIEVRGGDVVAAQTWVKTDVPYFFTTGVAVEAAVTVEPGVTLVFHGAINSRLIVDDAGSLTAIGTAEDTIRFLSEPAAAGTWEGIEVRTNSPDNELGFVEVAYGGRGSYYNIRVNGGAQLKLTNSLIRGSDRHGLYVDGVLAGFGGNTFRDNALAPVSVRADQMGALDGASTYAGGNGADRIEVRGGDVVAAQTWVKTDVPYFFTTGVGVEAAVTVEPGVTLVFHGAINSRLIVDDAGSLTAIGTATDTIRFLSEPAAAGTWEGIEVRTNSPDNELGFVEVAYGGRGGYHNIQVNGGAQITVTSSLIRDSAAWGIYVQNQGQLTESGNTYSGNADGDVRLP